MALVVAVALGVAFVGVERSVAEPTLPLGLLAHRVRLGAYVVAGLLFASLYPSFFLLSRVLQQVWAIAARCRAAVPAGGHRRPDLRDRGPAG